MHQVTTFIVIIIMIFIGAPWLPNNTKMATDYISCSVALNSRVLDLSRRQLSDFPSSCEELGNIEVQCRH